MKKLKTQRISIKNIKHTDFFFNEILIRHKMKRIQSILHKIRPYDACKIYLSCFDDKRYILDHGINSLAYFHKNLESQ